MSKLDDNVSRASSNGQSEIRLKARAVSRGVAVGRAVCLYGTNRNFFQIEIEKSQIDSEIGRLHKSIRTARRRVAEFSARKNGTSANSAGIFYAQKAMLEDPELEKEISKAITEKLVNAEWAVKIVTDRYISTYKAISDEHFRDRYQDVEDIADRLLDALAGTSKRAAAIGPNAVIVGEELRPSALAEMVDSHPKALITENGGWTSHTFILARELEIPAVTGLTRILRRVKNGDPVVVDGYHGQVIINPSGATLDRYLAAEARFHEIALDESAAIGALHTLDGREVVIRANLDVPAGYPKAQRLGARGVGLYRSEFLVKQFRGVPSENEQTAAYCELARIAGEDGVKIRTFDLGVEQLQGSAREREKNPALGLRGVRLSLANRKYLRVQLRALLRASAGNRLDIVVPMVSGLAEVREIAQLIRHERRRLEKNGIDVGSPRLGVMIEVPSAVLLAKELAEETDFICLGTNDLVQYLLAVDRDNESVADWFRTLHPSVNRAIATVVDACVAARKPLIVCGEMAGSPFYVPLLIGLGVNELSMNVNSIPRVRRVVAGIAYEEARVLAEEARTCRTADEVEAVLLRHINANWIHLFPPNFFASRTL